MGNHLVGQLSKCGVSCRNGGIRTRDPLNPIQVRYRAALRSVLANPKYSEPRSKATFRNRPPLNGKPAPCIKPEQSDAPDRPGRASYGRPRPVRRGTERAGNRSQGWFFVCFFVLYHTTIECSQTPQPRNSASKCGTATPTLCLLCKKAILRHFRGDR